MDPTQQQAVILPSSPAGHMSASVREVCQQCSGSLVRGDSTTVYAGRGPGMKFLKEVLGLVQGQKWPWHN
jgi:hypothetical protein